jgi:hypothetical protein
VRVSTGTGSWVTFVRTRTRACVRAYAQMEADHLSAEELRRVMVRFASEGYAMQTFGGDLVAYLPRLGPLL